jgi:23S rRNA (cytidine1920-2'-O)/16S rRNA (cytidine1409-2'-O)-methyltransferase
VKARLDILLVERGLAETRARAQAIIMGGGVAVDGTVVTKPAKPVNRDAAVALTKPPMPYVSRGGLKLRRALDVFDVPVAGVVALDVGASTGGFTDVLLEAGAKRVYAVDVGYGQLDWRLRNDPRVVVMERTNIRRVTELPERPDLAVIDVSFISLRLVLPVVRSLLAENGNAVALIKPQFEAGRELLVKGVVRNAAVRRVTVQAILRFAVQTDWSILGLERSPIKGPAGNIEFLAYLTLRDGESHELDQGGRPQWDRPYGDLD